MPNTPAADVLGIPPDLDRALARTVLDDVRTHRDADGVPDALTAAVGRVIEALAAQGARASEVLLAVEDAFAALVAGQGHPARRARVRALDAHARELVAARLGYGLGGTPPHGGPAVRIDHVDTAAAPV